MSAALPPDGEKLPYVAPRIDSIRLEADAVNGPTSNLIVTS